MMDLYTDCPECESRGYDTDTWICKRCIGTTYVPVRVKALEWDVASSFKGLPWLWASGPYSVSITKQRYQSKIKSMRYSYPRDVFTSIGETDGYDTLDAAKAACQQHHERMVMAMLEIVP